MATISQVVNDAAKRLGLLGVGQTLSSAISSDLTDAYGEVYAQLESLQIPTWESSAAIPDQYVWAMGALVANHRLIQYSPPPNRAAVVRADAFEAMRVIRAMQERPKMGATKIENY